MREAAKGAMSTLSMAAAQPGGPIDVPFRPSAAEVARACRRVIRCFRGAAYAVEPSRGLGGLAP